MRIYRETERLILRTPAPDEADLWFKVISQRGTQPYLYGAFKNLSEAALREQMRVRHEVDLPSVWFSILEKESGVFVGCCGLTGDTVVPHGLDAFYYLLEDKVGYGFAAEALQALIGVGVHSFGAAAVTALMDSGNERSANTAVRAGMHAIGTLPNPRTGKDMAIFAFPDQPELRQRVAAAAHAAQGAGGTRPLPPGRPDCSVLGPRPG